MRLIEADALSDKGEVLYIHTTSGKIIPVMAVSAQAINNAPTVDAVPVVRCRDCTWFSHGFCVCFDLDVMPDDFCSRGHVET